MTSSPLLRALAGAVLVLVLGYALLVFVAQRSILFPRPDPALAPPRPADARVVWLATTAGRIEAWYLAPLVEARAPAPLILYFHGNGELIDFAPGDFAAARGAGLGVLLVEYPGYGRSSGSPSESAIAETALAAYDWARAEPLIDGTRIAAMGRSLGGGAATIVAARRPIAALVLESTFTSVRSFARRFWMPELAVRDPFENLASLQAFSGPTLILHGRHDELIPVEHGQTLARAASRGRFHALACGHNDCVRPWPVILAFLAEHGVAAR